MRVAEYPGAINVHSDSQIRENLENGSFKNIVDGLTKNVTSSPEKTAPSVTRPKNETVAHGSLEEINRIFMDNGWTDGLPVVPPTTDKIEEFLKLSAYSPDEQIAILPQANLVATPRNIAANAVMAGCLPEHMPLLIAAVQAIGDPVYALMSIGTTAGLTPWLLVNGPAVKELGIESGVGLVSRGPNPAIGRAFRLILSNIAGYRPGQTWMGTWGYIPPFVIAEDDESCLALGWQPYHVEHGFDKDASTVTVRPTFTWGPQAFPEGDDPLPILQLACDAQHRVITADTSLRAGDRCISTILITPPTAKILSDHGYSKHDVAEYLWQHTRLTRREIDRYLNCFAGDRHSLSEYVKEGRIPKWFDTAPDESLPILAGPEQIDIVVCGDTKRAKMMALRGDYNKPVTKQIKLK